MNSLISPDIDIEDDKPPPLPVKTRRSTRSTSSDSSFSNHNYVNCELTENNLLNHNLDNTFIESNNYNKEQLNYFRQFSEPELVDDIDMVSNYH